MDIAQLFEILRIYSGVRGFTNLHKMINEELTTTQYLNNMEEHSNKRLLEQEENLKTAQKAQDNCELEDMKKNWKIRIECL